MKRPIEICLTIVLLTWTNLSAQTTQPLQKLTPNEAFKQLPEIIQKTIIRGELAKRERIKQLEKIIPSLTESLSYNDASQKKDIQEQIDQFRKEENQLRYQRVFYAPKLNLPLPSPIDPDETGTLPSVAIIQVIDGTNAIAGIADYSSAESVWLSGIDTSGMVNGKFVLLPDLFRVTRTKQYKSTDGSTNTIPLLTPLDDPAFSNKAMLAVGARLADKAERDQLVSP